MDTKLKTLEEKLDVIIDLLLDVHGHVYPDAKFRLAEFSDGSARFIPAADVDNKGVTDDE